MAAMQDEARAGGVRVRGARWRPLAGRFAAIVALLAGVNAAAPARADDAAPIEIGMVTPLTGAAAESGRYAEWGAEMAVAEVNAAGGVLGRPLKLVIEDDQTTNPGVVSASARIWFCKAMRAPSRRAARMTSSATILLVPSQIEPRWASRTSRGSGHSSI